MTVIEAARLATVIEVDRETVIETARLAAAQVEALALGRHIIMDRRRS